MSFIRYSYGTVLHIFGNKYLQSLGLTSLRSISGGHTIIRNNSQLCYLDKLKWKKLCDGTVFINHNTPPEQCGKLYSLSLRLLPVCTSATCLYVCYLWPFYAILFSCEIKDRWAFHIQSSNAPRSHRFMKWLSVKRLLLTALERHVCDEECKNGCWGPGNMQCEECHNSEYKQHCLKDCTGKLLFSKPGSRQCESCHAECKSACTGPVSCHTQHRHFSLRTVASSNPLPSFIGCRRLRRMHAL